MQEAEAAEQAALTSTEEAEAADGKAAVSQETAKKLADAGAPDAEAAASTSARWRAQVRACDSKMRAPSFAYDHE